MNIKLNGLQLVYSLRFKCNHNNTLVLLGFVFTLFSAFISENLIASLRAKCKINFRETTLINSLIKFICSAIILFILTPQIRQSRFGQLNMNVICFNVTFKASTWETSLFVQYPRIDQDFLNNNQHNINVILSQTVFEVINYQSNVLINRY